MIRHALGIVGAVALIFLGTLLPFLPGRYDNLAVSVSILTQAGALLGLVLVPFGLLWIVADRSPRLRQRRTAFAVLALLAGLLVWLGVFFVATMQSGYALGFILLAVLFVILQRAWAWFQRRDSAALAGNRVETHSALPFYLAIVPVVVVLLQFALLDRAIEFSRNRAIHNSVPLIAAIEQYRATNGFYPASIQAVWPDYWPNVIGIEQYRYEPHGEAYNLYFEQLAYSFGTREFVMYNPRDEHVMVSHAIDILQITPAQSIVGRGRGHYAVNDASQPHWKYFWFD